MGSPGMTSWKDSRPELLALLWVLPGLPERALTDQIAWNGIRHTATPEDEHHLLYPCLLESRNHIRAIVEPTVYHR